MDNFFRQKEIKKLRKIAGGDTYTIIYQEMMLLSLENGGKLFFDDFGEDIAEEIALELDESPENVRVTISYLMAHGLMTVSDGTEFMLEKVPAMVGSETPAAERMRRSREKKCNNVTLGCNIVTPQLQNVTPQLHREEKNREENNNNREDDVVAVVRGLVDVGVEKGAAEEYIRRYGLDRVAAVLAAAIHQAKSHPPAWIDKALRENWALSSAATAKAAPNFSDSLAMAQEYVANQYHVTGDPSWSCPSDYPAHGRIGSPYGMVTLERAMQLAASGGAR